MGRAGSSGSGGSRSTGSSSGARSRSSNKGSGSSSRGRVSSGSIDLTLLILLCEKYPVLFTILMAFYYNLCSMLDRYKSSEYAGLRHTLSLCSHVYLAIAILFEVFEIIVNLLGDKLNPDLVKLIYKCYSYISVISFIVLLFIIDWPQV